jgi:hypothetical protein
MKNRIPKSTLDLIRRGTVIPAAPLALQGFRRSAAGGALLARLPLRGKVRELENILHRAVALSEHEELALDGAHGGTAIAAARERRAPAALQLQVEAPPRGGHDLAQEHCAPVAQPGDPIAELVAGVGEGDRLGAFWEGIAAPQAGIAVPGAEFDRELGVPGEQLRRTHRCRCDRYAEGGSEPGHRVVERQGHGLS